MSWSNPITNLDMEIWDIDAIPSTVGETVNIVTGATISPVALNSTDIWNASKQTLGSDGTANSNSASDNFTVLNFFDPLGFNSITFNWTAAGTGIMGIGAIENISGTTQPVPEPATILLLSLGLVGLAGFRKKFKKV